MITPNGIDALTATEAQTIAKIEALRQQHATASETPKTTPSPYPTSPVSTPQQQQPEQPRQDELAREDRMWRWHRSGIPKRHADDLRTRLADSAQPGWTALTEAWKAQTPTGTILLCGINGTGKTTLAALWLWLHTRTPEASVKYTTARTLIDAYLDAQREGSVEAVTERYVRPAALVIDDVQGVKGSDHTAERLMQVVDSRYQARKSTLLVTNRTAEIAVLELGPAVSQRIAEDGGMIECDWNPVRRNA